MITGVNQSVVKKLFIICLSFLLFACNNILLQKSQQSSVTSSPTPILTPTISTSNIRTGSSISDVVGLPSTASIIPSIITPQEIAIREEQLKIAQELERLATLRNQAGVMTRFQLLQVTHYRLTNEIQLLQAKQLLQQGK
ncbi:MAG: hypothetical protein KME29_08845 [Calothrix sp. FI2-JRJ7]|jgi:hypothetical protein|nr:hypothetical protein [Calothrix sp. FI2-JRJ7]